ncbi:MAG TPA: glycosyltransferase 87 family protein [Thermoleophilaceae bacterium]|nr:glycosyltransferase 87 family protein [Thermoleophilaceae bacterium]
MPSIVTRRGLAAALAAAVVVCAFAAWGAPLGVDYLAPPCEPYLCDDAGPPIEAIAGGDVHGFFAEQPPMGSFSLLLRAPFAAAAKASGGDHASLYMYRAGAFACLLALALLAVWTMAAMLRRGRPRLGAFLVPTALLAGPLTYAALDYGHPEELLGAALCTGGVLAAGRGRSLWAGVLLGCAIATKQWAILAVPVAIVAAPRGRVRMPLFAAAFAGLFTLPMMLADPSRFWLAQKSVGIATTFTNTVTASNVWFLFAHGSTAPTETADGVRVMTQYSLSDTLGHLTHPLVVVLALAATVVYAVRRRGADPEEALQLLALVFLVRCVFDPLTYSYHHAPFLVALLVFEGLRRRVPVLSGFAIAALLVMTYVVAPMHDATALHVFYLAWSLPLMAALAVGTLAPERAERVTARLRALRPAAAASS